ncbi:hypothetical protein OU994_16370 [Pseudoduganella sp. SL102]|uniref:hypothetical protein n=1 Tax=Pseudoduganella sp. SL102 TaxID=2995154 RepID=UPI00248AC45B|nr:hypothetical protein [Pseudoduganella sp. SL102]WBR99899.1 hypothetical protein OU994_16370 [Pseudoduganella sp. SL102]
MNASMKPLPRAAYPLLVLGALLAGCAMPPAGQHGTVAVAAPGACGPCCERDPAAEASATQGRSAAWPDNPYPGKDTYANVVLAPGTVLYSLTPGAPPRFAVAEQTLRDAAGQWDRYYALVQVTTDPGKDADGKPRTLRELVRTFHVTDHVCAARGIAVANKQFGAGGGTQYYISPADGAKLRPGENLPITRWYVAEIDGR